MTMQRGQEIGRDRKISQTWIPWLLLVLLAFAVSGVQAQVEQHEVFSWVGPDGEYLPFKSRLEIENFLRTARVTAVKKLSVGITQPRRVTLEADGIQMHAVFRHVEVYKQIWKKSDGETVLNFRDSCVFELASYRLDQLLGINRVPPTVAREFSRDDFEDPKLIRHLPRHKGTLQAWVEEAQTERNRLENRIKIPRPMEWVRQMTTMRVFDSLTFNDDRNQGNILIGPDWQIWLIDATRAFRPLKRLKDAEKVEMCERRLWQRLKEVTDDKIRTALDGLLREYELSTLLVRRQKLVSHLEQLIQQKGESRVIFDDTRSAPRVLEAVSAETIAAVPAS